MSRTSARALQYIHLLFAFRSGVLLHLGRRLLLPLQEAVPLQRVRHLLHLPLQDPDVVVEVPQSSTAPWNLAAWVSRARSSVSRRFWFS